MPPYIGSTFLCLAVFLAHGAPLIRQAKPADTAMGISDSGKVRIMRHGSLQFEASDGQGVHRQEDNATSLFAQLETARSSPQSWQSAIPRRLYRDKYDEQAIAFTVSDLMNRSDLIALSEICKQLHIDHMGCLRAEAYIGSTLLNLTSALYLKHKVHDQGCKYNVKHGCVTTKTGLLHADSSDVEGQIVLEYANLFRYIPNVTEREHRFIMLDNAGPLQTQRLTYPTLTSTASVPDPTGNSVIVRMYRDRYEQPVRVVRNNDLPFSKKIDVLVWRGSSRCKDGGPHFKNRSRNLFVQKYGNIADERFDVGFAGDELRGVPPSQLRPSMDIPQQLKYKFIMVIDGVDVATNMEWAMASNSVPFMLSCKVQRWGLHSWLRPWKHYIPIEDDFSDLPAKISWAISNPTLAELIANNGKDFMRDFDDKELENRINAAVLVAYFNRVRIEKSEDDAQLVGDVPHDEWKRC